MAFFLDGMNFALSRPAFQSSLYNDYVASKAVDGDENTLSHTQNGDLNPWWKIHLAYSVWVKYVKIVNTDNYGKQNE